MTPAGISSEDTEPVDLLPLIPVNTSLLTVWYENGVSKWAAGITLLLGYGYKQAEVFSLSRKKVLAPPNEAYLFLAKKMGSTYVLSVSNFGSRLFFEKFREMAIYTQNKTLVAL